MQHAIIAKLHKRVLCVQDKHGQIERPGPITQIQRHPYSIAQPPEAAKALQLTRHLRHLRGTQRGRGLYHGGKFERMDNLVTIHIRSMSVDGQHNSEACRAKACTKSIESPPSEFNTAKIIGVVFDLHENFVC